MSTPSLLLAIDAGTSGVRALVFDRRAAERGSAHEELAIACPRPGWVETDPVALWQAARRVMVASLRAAGAAASDVAAVGIANQRATAVLWEKRSGAPLHDAIVWQDVRTAERVAELQRRGVFASTMASSTKLEWLLRNVAGAAERARRGELCFGTVDSWLAWELTGGRVHATDASNASCTGLYDYGSGEWDDAILAQLEIPRSVMPEIVPSSDVIGRTDAAAAGFAAPLAALAGDQQASMFGLRRHRRGDFKITFGTSAMVDVNTGITPVLSQHGAYPLVLWQLSSPRLFCLEGSAITAGAAVQWLRDGLGIVTAASQTSGLATQVEDSGGVWVVPAFQGLGTPYMEPGVRAMIGGLSRASGKEQVVRATLEGISFRCREIVQALVDDTSGDPPPVLRADGGAAENDFLLQHLANTVGVPVERPRTVQGTALGAAMLAGAAIGFWSTVDELDHLWQPQATFEPVWDASRRADEVGRWSARIELAKQSRQSASA